MKDKGMADNIIKELELVKHPNDILSTECQPVLDITIETKQLIHSMVKTMRSNNGIGLAAPQIGENVRIAVIDYHKCTGTIDTPLILINPVITKVDNRRTVQLSEGCLSIPGQQYSTVRSTRCTVKFWQTNGYLRTLATRDLLAVCVQHEVDHLNGRTIHDHGTLVPVEETANI